MIDAGDGIIRAELRLVFTFRFGILTAAKALKFSGTLEFHLILPRCLIAAMRQLFLSFMAAFLHVTFFMLFSMAPALDEISQAPRAPHGITKVLAV